MQECCTLARALDPDPSPPTPSNACRCLSCSLHALHCFLEMLLMQITVASLYQSHTQQPEHTAACYTVTAAAGLPARACPTSACAGHQPPAWP